MPEIKWVNIDFYNLIVFKPTLEFPCSVRHLEILWWPTFRISFCVVIEVQTGEIEENKSETNKNELCVCEERVRDDKSIPKCKLHGNPWTYGSYLKSLSAESKCHRKTKIKSNKLKWMWGQVHFSFILATNIFLLLSTGLAQSLENSAPLNFF